MAFGSNSTLFIYKQPLYRGNTTKQDILTWSRGVLVKMVITELRRKRFISCCSHEYSRMQTNYSKSLHIKNSCCLLSFCNTANTSPKKNL